MKIKIIKIGKVTTKEIISLVATYEKRLKLFCPVELVEYKDSDKAKIDQIFEDLKLKTGSFIVLLDERGKQLSSPNLAKFVTEKTENPQIKTLIFAVGGAYGFSDECRKKADFLWSLSEGVFPNELAWLIVWEQIYRAFNIIKGTSYHHE